MTRTKTKDYIRPAPKSPAPLIGMTPIDTRMDAGDDTEKLCARSQCQGVPTMDIHSNRKTRYWESHRTQNARRTASGYVRTYQCRARREPLGAEASYPHTDALIRMIRRKNVVKAVSVGAYGGIHRCNVCGNDMWRSWDCCRHWPVSLSTSSRTKTATRNAR